MNAKYLMKVAALISTLLSGCALTPISHKVEVPTPAQWQNAPMGDTTADRDYHSLVEEVSRSAPR